MRAVALRGLAVALTLAALPVSASASGTADGESVESECVGLAVGQDYPQPFATEKDSLPLRAMEVPEAAARVQATGKQPGEGVVVAVLDSGIPDSAGLPVVEHVQAGAKQPPSYYHGAAVAGLIAGPARPEDQGGMVGIAPGAQLLDVQVYDDPAADPERDPDISGITEANVLAGLDAVLARMGTLNIKVVTIALALPFDDAPIRQRIARIWKKGAVVVAPTGNRPSGDEASYLDERGYGTHTSGEDAKKDVHPADFKHVLAVNSSMTGALVQGNPYGYVLENSATVLAAPTAQSVSYAPVGGTCTLTDPATSWAAAEVSGVLALTQSVYDETPAQAVSRLVNTANGRPDVPNTLVGAGEVQVLDALTRPMVMAEDGTVESQGTILDEPQQLSAPKDPPDLLASTRRNAVWWGLVGGGVLLLAVVLRPVLARRRRTPSATL